MADKSDLRRQIDRFEELLPGRKKDDLRIHSDDDQALVALLRQIVEALPD